MVDLGWIHGFARKSTTVVAALLGGAPASVQAQARGEIGAEVGFAFESWGKLQMALAAGTQQMNVLATAAGAVAAYSGGVAQTAAALAADSTAVSLDVGAAAAAGFAVGGFVTVDVDCGSTTLGYVGAGVSGAYLRGAVADVDYVRRVSLNVARVSAIGGGVLTLESPLPAGVPVAGMKASAVVGFCDREGSSFFQEWSALFVGEGQQGERVFWHYPRLESMAGIGEELGKSVGGYAAWRLSGRYRALPVVDALDGERVVCFRTYVAG